MEYEFKDLSVSDLHKRIQFIQNKFEESMMQLKLQFKKDCDPLEKLYEKKIELEEISEKLVKNGYVEEESKEVKPVPKRPCESNYNNQLAKNYTSFNNQGKPKKHSASPIKGVSKTETNFYNRSESKKLIDFRQ